MKRAPSVVPVFGTILLHAALFALAITVLTSEQKNIAPPKPIPVQLLQERTTPPSPLPVAPATPSPPPPRQKKAEAKPRAIPKLAPRPRESAPPRANAPAAPSTIPAPTAPSAAAAPAAQTPPATPAAPASAPVKTGVSIPANYAASNRKPPYPRLSYRNGEEGMVELRVFVKADGTAGKVEIASSSGFPLLDESAKSTVQTWRFNPATLDGKPVGEWYRVPVPFKLVD